MHQVLEAATQPTAPQALPCLLKKLTTETNTIFSGCGAVDSANASDTRGHWFESSPRQLLLNTMTVCRKEKEKEDGIGPFFKKTRQDSNH